MSTVTPNPNHQKSRFAEQMNTDDKSRNQPNPEDPSLSPFFSFMDELLACHHWDESDLQGGEFGNRFRTVLFEFVRYAATRPELRNKSGKDALQLVHKWLEARGHAWDDFSGLEGKQDEDGDMLFLRTWEELKFPAGEDPLTLARQKAIDEPVKLLEEQRLTEKYELFVGLAFHLQRFNDKHPTLQHAKAGCVVLPCYKLGFVMGVSHATIAMYRKFAVDHGFLIQEKRHTFSRQRGKSEATEFRFVLERFDPETRQELPVGVSTKPNEQQAPKAEPKSSDELRNSLPETLNPSKKKTPNYVMEPIIREHVWPHYQKRVPMNPALRSWTANRQRMAILCFREALGLANSKWNVSQAIQLMLRAIDNLAASDFHMGQNPKTSGQKFNDWEYVFGTVEKFKKWIGLL